MITGVKVLLLHMRKFNSVIGVSEVQKMVQACPANQIVVSEACSQSLPSYMYSISNISTDAESLLSISQVKNFKPPAHIHNTTEPYFC